MGLEMLKSCLSFRFDLILGISFSHKCLQCPMAHGVLWMPLATPCPCLGHVRGCQAELHSISLQGSYSTLQTLAIMSSPNKM